MRSKAPLVLIEQLLMVLVLALAAAVCVRSFALADRLSEQSQAMDQAVIAAENAAEVLKSCRGNYKEAADRLGGTWDGSALGVGYDKDWKVTDSDWCYLIVAQPVECDSPLLGSAEVLAYTKAGECLYGLPSAWQEAKK